MLNAPSTRDSVLKTETGDLRRVGLIVYAVTAAPRPIIAVPKRVMTDRRTSATFRGIELPFPDKAEEGCLSRTVKRTYIKSTSVTIFVRYQKAMTTK